MTKEKLIDRCLPLFGEALDFSNTVMGKYSDYITVKCVKHGEFQTKTAWLCAGRGCRKCYDERQTKSNETFIEECIEKHDGKYSYPNTLYTHSHKKVIVTCPTHGDFEIQASKHLEGIGCKECAHTSPYTIDSLVEKFNKIHNNKYDYKIDFVKNTKQNISIVCKKHGEFTQRISHHLHGSGCPKCNNSHGNNKVERILKSLELTYQSEYQDSRCKRIVNLKFDFVVFKDDSLYFIEFQGLHHYEPSFSTNPAIAQKNHELCVERDNIKRAFCRENNYPLLEIPYWESHKVESLIRGFLGLPLTDLR